MAAKLCGGGKKKRFDLGQNADINVTPFVDVMLVLLIIFMVTAPLATVSIKIDIPPAKAPTTPAEAADLHLDRPDRPDLRLVRDRPDHAPRCTRRRSTPWRA